jgi:hypothetical protein
MNATLDGTITGRPLPLAAAHALHGLGRELLRRQRTLTLFAAVLLALLLPAALALGLDHRVLRGAPVWLKPMKFLLSIAVFSLTTAWMVGFLAPGERRSRWVRAAVAVIVAGGSFEAVYIALQAGLGQASHYNATDVLHQVMYGLMGVGATLMTLTQPLLAWRIARHGRPGLAPALRAAVLWGLALTFVLGAGLGAPLSALQPPDASGLPLLGWGAHGDLRPAHFLGIHAQQLLPLAGAWLAVRGRGAGRVHALALLYMAATLAVAAFEML